MWLGKWNNRTDKPCNFTWRCDKLKILGIYVGSDVTPEDNWGPRINRTRCILDLWSKRNLTFYGKAVNTLVGAGINYVASVMACAVEYIKKIDDIIWKFVRNGKRDKIKRNNICGPKDLGGRGLINIQCKLFCLKLQRLSRFCSSKVKWKTLFNYWLCKASKTSVHDSNWYVFANTTQSIKTTPFYKELILAFSKVGGKLEC